MGILLLNNQFVTFIESESYKQCQRRRPSCFKKGVFNTSEEHVLECN